MESCLCLIAKGVSPEYEITVYMYQFYRHECFTVTGKYTTRKIHTKLHPGLEWCILHIFTKISMISLISQVLSLKLYLNSLVFIGLRQSLEVFGNLRKVFGNVRLTFGTILKIFGKWSEIFGKSSKKAVIRRSRPFSSPEPTILLVCGWDRSQPQARRIVGSGDEND